MKYLRDRPQTQRVLDEAKQRREEKRRQVIFHPKHSFQSDLIHNIHRKCSDPLRLIREQKRQVSKVLLDGLYDPDSPISKLLGVRMEVVGEIIWQKLVENWQIYPEHLRSSVDLPARKINCTVL